MISRGTGDFLILKIPPPAVGGILPFPKGDFINRVISTVLYRGQLDNLASVVSHLFLKLVKLWQLAKLVLLASAPDSQCRAKCLRGLILFRPRAEAILFSEKLMKLTQPRLTDGQVLKLIPALVEAELAASEQRA